MKQIYRVTALAILSTFLAAGCATSGGDKPGEIGGIKYKYKPTAAENANKELANKVAKKLKAEPKLANDYIFPSSNDGVVTLTGITKSGANSALAEKIAKSTEGVKSVVNKLTLN